MQDVHIGRSTQYRAEVITVPITTAGPLVPADPSRISLIIAQPSSDGVRLSVNVQATTTTGIALLAATDKPLILTLADYGAALLDAWNAISTGAGAVTVLVISVSLGARAADELPAAKAASLHR